MECYKCITDTLGYLWTASAAHPQSPSMPKSPGPPVSAPDTSHLPAEQAQYFVSTLLDDQSFFFMEKGYKVLILQFLFCQGTSDSDNSSGPKFSAIPPYF